MGGGQERGSQPAGPVYSFCECSLFERKTGGVICFLKPFLIMRVVKENDGERGSQKQVIYN